jgi:glycosyltransferase involved in cell wall biosynthesis
MAMGSDINIENSFVQRLTKRFIYHNCEVTFADSWKMKKRIEKEYGYRVMVIPSSADMSFFRPLGSSSLLWRKWGIENSSRVILTVCRLDKNKGGDILIRSLRVLDLADVKLLVVGEGREEKTLKQLSSELGLR